MITALLIIPKQYLKPTKLLKEIGLNIQLPPDGNNDLSLSCRSKKEDHAPFNDIGIPRAYILKQTTGKMVLLSKQKRMD